MTLCARFTKWGLGLFIFGVFLTFGVIAHYCVGSRWPNGTVFMQNITLWWACPWTLSVAAVQAGGLGMVALGLAHIAARRASTRSAGGEANTSALKLCIVGLLGVFAVATPATSCSMQSGQATTTRRWLPGKTSGCCRRPSSLASTLS